MAKRSDAGVESNAKELLETMRQATVVLSLVAIAVASCGHEPDRFIKARFGSRDGVATLATDRFVVVFESVPVTEGLESQWDLKVAGNTKHVQNCGLSRSKPEGVNLESVFLDGVNTITVSKVPGFQMRVSGGGRTAQAGGLVIDLETVKPKIVVRADGTVSVR